MSTVTFQLLNYNTVCVFLLCRVTSSMSYLPEAYLSLRKSFESITDNIWRWEAKLTWMTKEYTGKCNECFFPCFHFYTLCFMYVCVFSWFLSFGMMAQK